VPGTWGSAAAALGCLVLPGGTAYAPILVAAAAAFFAAGVRLARDAEGLFGRPDPGPIVLDEVVGMWLAAAIHPKPSPLVLLVAFVVFRAFDITKPFPIRRIERLPHGWGIFLDDVLAGLYTNAVVRLLLLAV